MTLFLPYQSHGWHGRIAKGWQHLFDDLDYWLAANPGESVVSFPSREVRRVETPAGAVYVKILRSGGGGVHDTRGWVGKLKWLARPSRAEAIRRISQTLLDEGFLCAAPLLAARRRSPAGWPTDLFISREIRSSLLAQRLHLHEVDQARRLLAQVADELRRFHQAGFVHGDCTPYNLALTDEGRLVLFDNDRTVRSPVWLRRQRQRRSLSSFGLRLTQLMQSLDPFREFLARYANGDKEEAERILRLTRKRLRAKELDFQ